MARALPVVIVVAVLALAFIGLALGWRARRRGQAALPAPAAVPPSLDTVRLRSDLLYVATTRAGAPLDRIAVRGLGFRARANLDVADSGLVLDLAGSPAVFIPRADIRGVGRATWTIDRVVDRDGLVFVRWALGDSEIDSYLRGDDPDAIVSAITDLLPTPAEEARP